MSCVEAIPVPDSRTKVDELFIFWLSEPSTQELLRKELSKVCGRESSLEDGTPFPIKTATATSVLRPGSPVLRALSPPTPLARSPKSPRAKRKPASPRKKLAGGGTKKFNLNVESTHNLKIDVVEEPDFHPSPLTTEVQPATDKTHYEVQASLPQEDDGVVVPVLSPEAAAQLPEQPKAEGSSAAGEPPLLPEVIPRFYFPNGRPRVDEDVEQNLREVASVFKEYPKGEVPRNEFHVIVKVGHTTYMYVYTHINSTETIDEMLNTFGLTFLLT